jgi:hypothetical protein
MRFAAAFRAYGAVLVALAGERAAFGAEQDPNDVPPEYRPAPEFFDAVSDDSARPVQPAKKNRFTRKFPIHHALFGEALGASGYYSVNYEAALGDVAVRWGVGAVNERWGTILTVPIGISYIGIGSDSDHAEIGAGVTFIQSGNAAPLIPGLLAGYRYQPPEGGLYLRIGVIGAFAMGGDSVSGPRLVLAPWPYVGMGGTF